MDKFSKKFKTQIEKLPASEPSHAAWNNFANYRQQKQIINSQTAHGPATTFQSILGNIAAGVLVVCSSYIFSIKHNSNQNFEKKYLIEAQVNFPKITEKYLKTDSFTLSQANPYRNQNLIYDTFKKQDYQDYITINRDITFKNIEPNTPLSNKSSLKIKNIESNLKDQKGDKVNKTNTKYKQLIVNNLSNSIVDSLVEKKPKNQKEFSHNQLPLLVSINNDLSLTSNIDNQSNYLYIGRHLKHFLDSIPVLLLSKPKSTFWEIIKPKTFSVGVNAGLRTSTLDRYEIVKSGSWGIEITSFISKKLRFKINVHTTHFKSTREKHTIVPNLFGTDSTELEERTIIRRVHITGNSTHLFTQIDFIPISFRSLSPFIGLGFGTDINSKFNLNYFFQSSDGRLVRKDVEARFGFGFRYFATLNTGLDADISRKISINLLFIYSKSLHIKKEQYAFTSLGFRYNFR